MPVNPERKKASSRSMSSYEWLGWNVSWKYLPKLGSMGKQFKGFKENLHKKIDQTRPSWYSQRSNRLSFFRCVDEGYAQSTYIPLVKACEKIHWCLLIWKTKSITKASCDHNTSGIDSSCFICEDSCYVYKKVRHCFD